MPPNPSLTSPRSSTAPMHVDGDAAASARAARARLKARTRRLQAVIAGHAETTPPGGAAVDLEEFLLRGAAGSPWGASLLLPAAGSPPADGEGFALWLGSADDALDLPALHQHGVTAIVNMALGGCEDVRRFVRARYRDRLGCEKFQYLAADALDAGGYPIWRWWKGGDTVGFFWLACRPEGRAVLVHCMQGVNRSAAVAAAFMARQGPSPTGGPGLGVLGAVDWISRRRQPVLQNVGFLKQLLDHGSPGVPWEPGEEEEAEAPPAAVEAYRVGDVLERGAPGPGPAAAAASAPAAAPCEGGSCRNLSSILQSMCRKYEAPALRAGTAARRHGQARGRRIQTPVAEGALWPGRCSSLTASGVAQRLGRLWGGRRAAEKAPSPPRSQWPAMSFSDSGGAAFAPPPRAPGCADAAGAPAAQKAAEEDWSRQSTGVEEDLKLRPLEPAGDGGRKDGAGDAKLHAAMTNVSSISTPSTPSISPTEFKSQGAAVGELEVGSVVDIGPRQFLITGILGRGSFGTVWCGECCEGKGKVAVKSALCCSPAALRAAEVEGALLRGLQGDSRHLPALVASSTPRAGPGAWHALLAMSLLPGGCLLEEMRGAGRELAARFAGDAVGQAKEACRMAADLLDQLAPAMAQVSALALHRDAHARRASLFVRPVPPGEGRWPDSWQARGWMAQAAVEDLDGGDEDLWEAPEAVVPAPVKDGPVPIVPLAVAQGRCYCSTGYTAGGLEQCRFAWRALRVSSAEPPSRFVKAEFLFSDDGYWDWWASHPGQPNAMTVRPLIHACSENPCSVLEGPGTCTELIHVSDGAELGLGDLRALFVECQETNPEAAWPAASLGPLVAAAAPARPAAVAKAAGRPPAAAGPPRAPPGAAPFDDFLSVRGSSRGPGSELAAGEEAAAAGGLGGKLEGARVRFEEGKRAAGDVNLDGFPLGAEAAGEGPVKKRSLGDLLVERAAKLKRAASDAAPRGSGDPVPDRALPGAGPSGGMAELAQALVMAIREGKEGPPGDGGGDGLGSSDPAAVPRDLATKRAFCRRMAAASPGRLTELSLQQMADFLGSQEGEAAVDATGPIALRYLLTIYLPQHPVKEIGAQTYRELRTLAEAVDLLMQGKAAHACDLIVQRLKALQVATTDGSWAAAKWLELIPPRDEPTAIRSEEEELIRSIQLGEMKLDELSARLAEGSAAPPPWKMTFAEMRKKFPKQPGETNTQHRLRGVAGPPLATALQCWSDELSFGFGKSIVAVDLAARLVAAVRRHPGSLGHFARSFSMRADTFCGSGGSSNRRVRDALPLPLPSTEEVDRWLAHSALPKARRCRRRAVAREVSEQAWLHFSVVALNYAFCGRAQEGWRHRPTLSKAQTQVYVHLKSRAAALAEDPLAMVVAPAIDELAGGWGSAYEGETGVKALPCRLCELAPGLPARECAATLDAIDFVDDEVGAWLRRPELALLDQSDWPDPLPRARVNVETDADWEELALHLASLGIFTTLAESELVRVRGEPVLNGLFAVEKKGTPAPGATRVTRLILNMVPGNSLLKAHVGEAALLAASTSWTSVVIPEGELLLWSGDDQKGAFFVWRVPPAWHPYMAVGRPLAGELFGRSEPVVYVTSAVIAMGWSLAVPVFQHIHRRLCRLAPPLGAGLPSDGEWRKDCARPLVEAGSGQDAGLWQVYIDDFDAPEIVEEVLARKLAGAPSDLQLQVRASYEKASVSFSAEKAHCRQLRVERMGADVDGVSGRLAVPAAKALATAGLCLAAVQRRLVPWRVAMAALGKLVRAFEFRRPLFGVLNSVWTLAASSAQGAYLDAEMVEELLMGVMVLPLAASSLRARIDGMVTSSDASEMGGGVCTSAGLREDVAAALQVPRTVPDQLGIGARLLNMPEDPARPWAAANPRVPARAVRRVLSVLLIGLFDGIGGLAVAFSRLPVRIAAFVAAETDAKARRVVRLRWPGVIDWGDVTRVGSETVRDLFEAFGGLVDLVVVAAGSPCQDLSRLNVGGRGLSGRKSSLFHEVPRILALLAAVFKDRLVWFVENVASMSDANVELILEALQVRPTLVCSSVFVPCRRPRLFWTSWGVTASAPLRLTDRGVYDELVGPGVPLMDLAWEDEGCSWPGRPRCFPTLVCCRPQPSFPSAPRGFAAASETARQRWAADGHRYHVALYEDKNMICIPSFPFLRLPTSEERERLLGFDVGYTSLATKGSNPQGASDARAFLLGNSFSIHVVAWLRQQLLHRRGALNRELSIEEVSPVRVCRATRDQAGAFVTEPGERDTAEARQLVLHYLSRAEKGGSDVRLDYGAPYRPRGWPRTSLGPFVWKWRVVVSMAWPGRSSTHINVRELQAATAAIRWRARKVAQHGSRFLHLVDSQVVAAIVTKGRSSSRKLQPILRRWMAVVVAADMYPLIGYVVSEDNPADEPSRPAPVRRRGTRCQTLSSLRVSAETRRRYGRALRALLAHFGAEQAGADALRGDPEDADALVAEYLEGLWASGAGIAAANSTLAGVCFAVPRLRRHLDLSWTLLKAWRHHEPASRVLPLTTEAVAAMAGFACAAGAFDVAALLLVGFEGMLRGAEVFALTAGDIVDRGELFIVRISSSKTTAGKDCAEAVVVRSRMAVALLRIADSVRAQPGSEAARAVARGLRLLQLAT
ncbi:unnamed protein product, partial [Prorocentrum cordatum]